MSKISAQRGKALEEHIRQQNDLLRQMKRAAVARSPDPVTIESKDRYGKVHGRPSYRELCDFIGTIKGGLAVMFDAKATTRKNFEFKMLEASKGGRDRSQRQLLAEFAAFGGVAFVYVRHHPDQIRHVDYLFPVDAEGIIAHERSRKSIPLTSPNTKQWQIRPGQTWFDKLREILTSAPKFEDDEAAAVETETSTEDAPEGPVIVEAGDENAGR